MDPLSTAASVIAVVQAIAVGLKIYNGIKDAKAEIAALEKELTSIEALAEKIRTELCGNPNGPKLSTGHELSNALENCKSELERLQDKLGKKEKNNRFNILRRRAKWPLTGPDASKIIQNLRAWNQNITLALSIDHT